VGHVYLPCNDGKGRCQPADYWYIADSCDVTAFQKKTENTVFDSGCGLPGRVFQNGEAAWVRDVTVDPNFPRADKAKESGIVGGAAFPVKIKNEVVAILEFYSTQSMEPSPQLMGILTHVCTQVGRVAERDRSEKTLMTRVAAELKKRDQKLVEQNKLFDAALKNMSQGLCMFDKEQRLIVSNDRYAQMYDLPPKLLKPGITLRQILEHRIANGIYAGKNPDEYYEERQKWVTSGISSNKVQELSDGRWMSINHQPMQGGGWLTTHEDITERKKTEKALQESQELFSKAFHLSPVPLSFSNPKDGSYHNVNDSWSRVFGFSHEEAIASSALDLGIWINPKDRSDFLDWMKHNDGTSSGFEISVRTKRDEVLDMVAYGEYVEVRGEEMLFMVFHDITASNRAKKAQRESQELFTKAFKASPAAMAISDPETAIILDVNEAWTNMLGFSREEALNANVYDLGFWIDIKERERFIDVINKEGSAKAIETTLRTKDGRIIFVVSYGEKVEVGGQPRLLFVSHDITERKRSEEALRESEQQFKTLVETTNVVPWEFDPNSMLYTYVGPQAQELLGYPLENWYTEGFWQSIIHPDDRDATVKFCLSAVNQCQDHDIEYRTITADGRIVWVRDVISVDVKDGNAKRIRGILINISERKQADESLKASEQRFKDIVEVSSDWVWEYNEHLQFTYLSERFSQVTGRPKKQFLGKTPQEVTQNTGPKWDAHLADLNARRPFREFMSKTVNGEGETQYWMISGRPMFDESGRFMGYRGTGADRTAEVRDQAELIRHRDHLQDLVDEATIELSERAEELRQALTKEKELNEIQRQFVYMASHEFRTPLAIIDSAAQRMLRKVETLTPQDTAKRVEKIRGAVGRMTRLMESTLDAARIEEGKIDIKISDCDLRFIILDVEMHQIELSQNHNISSDLNDLPSSIRGDNGALNQIFSNLISNAVKYSPDASDIHVRGWVEGQFVVVEVKDHGLGIDEQDLPKMFQRFFRANTSSGIAGTGIGLNLVKTLVELHEGSIQVRSEKGTGSVFTVRLPIEGPVKVAMVDGQAA
jgi:PAS domain S-box-containing protein